MVPIFTDTTSVLSSEFVSIFSGEKLALALFRISQDIGVEVSQAQRSYSIIGDWSKVLQAHSKLVEYFEKEQKAKLELRDNDIACLNSSQNFILNEGRRGRKPGCTVAKTAYDVVPEPYVQYLNDQGLQVNIDNQKKERRSLTDKEESLKVRDKEDLGTESEGTNNNFLLDRVVENKDNEISLEDSNEDFINNNSDGEYVTVKEEFDENVMDDDTDVDDQYVGNSDLQMGKKTDSSQLNTNVKVKIERNSSEDEGKIVSKSKRKTKLKKQELVKGDNKKVKTKKSDVLNKKKGKGRPKKQKNEVDSGRKKRKTKSKIDSKIDEDTEYKCDKCEYVGKKKENLREHTQRMHRSKFSCEICKKQFGLHKDLLRHTRHVHTNPAYHCKICDKFYKFSRAYKEHMLSHEENYIKPQFECDECHKVFSTKYVLTAHVKSEHLGMKKSFMCPTCGRSFTQKNSYLMHANVHAGIKPYVCDVCGKAFSYDKSLKEHKYMHDDERRFSCHICAKTFRQKTSLLMHMKVHKEAKDYICTSCGKGFTQKQALLRHERIHSGDKPFKCALCSRSFNDYSIIRRHMMMHHKRDKDPKTWRGDIICSLKRKTEFYIEGGPGYNGGDRLPTHVADDDSSQTVPNTSENVPNSSKDDIGETEMAVQSVFAMSKSTENSLAISQQTEESFMPSNTQSQSVLPDCAELGRSYHSQGIPEPSDIINKSQDTSSAPSPSLPINYSMPTNYQSNLQNIPVTSVSSPDSDAIQPNQYHEMSDSFRMQNNGHRREIFMQNLTSMAPLSALPQTHHLAPVSVDTTQGQPVPNLWGLPGYPSYYNPANFPHYQGPQN